MIELNFKVQFCNNIEPNGMVEWWNMFIICKQTEANEMNNSSTKN